MKLVQFYNGNYGIRKGFIFKRYIDMKNKIMWWPLTSAYISDCETTKEEAISLIKRKTEKPIIIKDY